MDKPSDVSISSMLVADRDDQRGRLVDLKGYHSFRCGFTEVNTKLDRYPLNYFNEKSSSNSPTALRRLPVGALIP